MITISAALNMPAIRARLTSAAMCGGGPDGGAAPGAGGGGGVDVASTSLSLEYRQRHDQPLRGEVLKTQREVSVGWFPTGHRAEDDERVRWSEGDDRPHNVQKQDDQKNPVHGLHRLAAVAAVPRATSLRTVAPARHWFWL
jgi:hypothetical protein